MLVVLFFRVPAQGQTEVVNGIAVIVNDAVITYKDVQSYIGSALEVLERQFSSQPPVLKQKALDAQREGIEQLVEQQLILHDFKTAGYNLPESIIEDSIKRDIRERFGDRVTLTKTLQSQGMTFEGYRQQSRDRIIVEALRAKNVSSEILISPNKIETFYQTNSSQFAMADQVKLRMLVFNKPAGSGETPRKLAAEVLKKLDEGAPFAEMASIYSEGSQRSQGGDWGWVERSVLRKDLADAAFSLTPGQRSQVIETPDACYIMLVEERRSAHVKPLKDVADEIEKTLINQERARLQKKYVERLKKKSFIRYF